MARCSLTAQQKRLWIEWKLNPRGHYYNINAQFRLSGPLDHQRFALALHTATGYFEAFRIQFAEQDGMPVQIVHRETPHILEVIDLTDAKETASDLDQHAHELLITKAREPIDLTSFPLMRALLVKTAPDVHYFMLITPHILSDGQSGKMIFEAISSVYNSDADQIAKLERHAGETISNYLIHGNSQATDETLRYWEKSLEGAPLNLIIEKQRITNRDGRRLYFELDEMQTRSLKAIARAHRTTVFNTLASVYSIFLARHFDTDDLVFTYPVNIRGAKFSHAFGFFINTIPLRVTIGEEANLLTLIADITSQRRSDRMHENCSTDEILRELRKTGHQVPESPFNISFGQTSFSANHLILGGLTVDLLRCDPTESASDLSLQYDASSVRAGFYWEYNVACFNEGTIAEFTASFISLMTQAFMAPYAPIRSLSLLNDEQYKEIVRKSSNINTDRPDGRFNYPLYYPFEERATSAPDSIALISDNGNLTYSELEVRSSQLAHDLRNVGVRRHDLVAVCMDRSESMIIVLLAVLKAGAAYVPIDPHYPNDRMAKILNDCQPKLTVCSRITASLEAFATTPLYCVDDIATVKDLAQTNHNAPHIAFDGDDAAYVIYTSGSSGAPKGVIVSHANVNARLEWLQQTITLSSKDRALHTINYCFDPSVFEIFWPLRAGAVLVLPRPGISQDPQALINVLDKENITFFSTIPSLLRLFLIKLQEGQCLSLRYALCGGEVLPRMLANDFLKRTTARLFNAYGPTETTILASCHECIVDESQSALPIGRPLGETAIYVVDHQNNLRQWGAVGELCIAGPGVAKGYLNQAPLTAKKFVRDRFSKDSDGLMYKTGDIGRYLPNGEIEFSGRLDSQIKVRGFRIEPEEVEHAIRQIPGVAQAAVVAQVIPAGHRLVGFYCPASVNKETLRLFLAKHLPEHMVPSLLVPLDTMPLTHNSKVDYTALPDPQTFELELKYSRPLTKTEQQLKSVYSKILRIDPIMIRVDEKFFDMGGDSLQAIELALLVNQSLNVNLSDTIIFEHSTITMLAKHIDQHHQENLSINHSLVDRVAKRQQALMARRKLQSV